MFHVPCSRFMHMHTRHVGWNTCSLLAASVWLRWQETALAGNLDENDASALQTLRRRNLSEDLL